MRKKFLIGFICLFVFVIGIGLWGYNYFFGVDDGLRAQLRDEFSEEFFSFEDINLTNMDTLETINATDPINNLEEAISARYNVKLEMLEKSVNEKIDVLFQSAYNEYQQQVGGNRLNQTQLARKYLQAADMLEETVDVIFQQILVEMESELQRSQLSTDLVEEAREVYETMIKEKKSSIMQKMDGISW